MSTSFRHRIEDTAVVIQLVGPAGPVDWESWALAATEGLLSGVALVKSWEEEGLAVAEGPDAMVDHAAIAAMTAGQARVLGLPPVGDVVAALEARGVMTSPEFHVELRWQRPDGRPIVAPERVGAFLKVGATWYRLPDPLFGIAESVDALAQADAAGRFRVLRNLQELLPCGAVRTDGFLSRLRIAYAESVSLDVVGEAHDPIPVPVLHPAAGLDQTDGLDDGISADPPPLLPPDLQNRFATREFPRFAAARGRYALGDGWYVVTSEPLMRALEVVRKAQSGPASLRRTFIGNPRPWITEALGEEYEATIVEKLFVETSAYSERVKGLGLWQRRVVPWIQVGGTDWFGGDEGTTTAPETLRATGGLRVGDTLITIERSEIPALRAQIEAAIAAGTGHIEVVQGDAATTIPATLDTLGQLQGLEDAYERATPKAKGLGHPAAAPEVLLIEDNFETVAHEAAFVERSPKLNAGEPTDLRTALKRHQKEGLRWLQESWIVGRPGVLLADDMGLGKTLQALAFLAWLRESTLSAGARLAPILVVAPTGLLENWRAEHNRHLGGEGLGRLIPAFGSGLAALRRAHDDGRPGLDHERLAEADWILTTYETLRDNQIDFGRIAFSVTVLDEVQKVKTPGTQITDAAKAMRSDFVLAMSGTPVENRLADLWCVVDTVQPGYLRDLKWFSAEYERNPDPERRQRLKAQLDRRRGPTPPLMLRRLKLNELDGLPPKSERRIEVDMPWAQLAAYEGAIAAARGAKRKAGAMLEALHRLRDISLHPGWDDETSDRDLVDQSARLRATIEILDTLRESGERALIFLEFRALQARLATLLQRRYQLSTPPMIISGAIAGPRRQALVDRFQSEAAGFNVMILSPKAGGVGLTLTAANHVIHLSRWWNPAVEDQCTDRAYRIGQDKPVTVHLPIAVLPGRPRPSFDENVAALLDRKRSLMHEMLLPPAATEADTEELFRSTLE